MIKSTSGYLDIDGQKLYYEVAGEGETVVLTHAGFVDSGMWDTQWEVLTPRYRVIRYDMRGYGKSDPVTAPVNRRDDLYRLLRQLKVERAVLIGCSMGGEISVDLTLEQPQLVSKLVLVSSVVTGFEMQGAPPPNLLEMIAAAQAGDIERTSELQLRLWVDGMYRTPEQVDPEVRRQAARMNLIPVKNNTFGIADSQEFEPLTPPAVSRLGEIVEPTLIIAGALDHPEIVRAADLLAREIKGAQKVILSDSAHVPNMEQPAAFNRALLAFLD
ncbi:MAG: alpha/beta hydrolase [Anaerolineae bacterium]|nr:alpha/beta hydrolase [Anaerolineae bacterium]